MKKIRFFDKGHGLLVSVSDVLEYLKDMNVMTEHQSLGISWDFRKDMIQKLYLEYKSKETRLQINILDFQDVFVCWSQFYYMGKYLKKVENNKIVKDLFDILDAPGILKKSDLFEVYNP